MENHAILRSIHRDFGEQDARIACKTCAIIAGSWFLPLRRDLIVYVERVAHFAQKSFEILDENRTILHRFLQSFGVRRALCGCATQAEVVFGVLQMMCGISAAFECVLRLFARIFDAKLHRF